MDELVFQEPVDHRSGYVAIAGRPNVGKSTLLNAFVSYRLAIVSSKPQTTRNRIMGIRTDAQSQIIFVDTPGIHQPRKELNRAMLEAARKAISDVDLILYLVDSQFESVDAEERLVAEMIDRSRPPVLLVPNKIDLVDASRLLPVIEMFGGLVRFERAFPVSASNGEGIDTLIAAIVERLPHGPRYYPDDQITDISERQIAAEIVREKIFVLTQREIPYSSAVEVERFDDVSSQNLLRIFATIHVEKDSQKGILIGRGGRMLKTIGQESRMELQRLFGARVYLELFVRVQKNWTHDSGALRRFGLLDKE